MPPEYVRAGVSVHLLAYALYDVRAQSTVSQGGLLSVSGACEGLDSSAEFMASAQSTLP